MVSPVEVQPPNKSQGTPSEAQLTSAVTGLRIFTLDEIGGSAWNSQQETLEQLNIQAHKAAQEQSGETVVEAIITKDKLSLLVHQLLTFEVWKEKVYPQVAAHLATEMDSVSAYMLLYHSAVIANLLEVCLFHEDACASMVEEYLLELCDWCYRQLIILVNFPQSTAREGRSLQELVEMKAEEDLSEKSAEIDLSTALSSLTIIRYISDTLDRLALGVTARLAETNDTLMALLAVMERAPWQRRRNGKLQSFSEGSWRPVPPAERLRVSQSESQVWLLLHNMLVNPQCRAKCGLDEPSRREAVLGLRSRMNELLTDQLPFLKALQYVLDHLTLGCPDDRHIAQRSRLIIEQEEPHQHKFLTVSTVRERLLARHDWKQVASRQRETVFSKATQQVTHQRLQGLLQAFESALIDDDVATATQATKITEACKQPVKVQTWRKIGSGIYEPWSDFACEIDPEKPGEDVQLANGEDCILHGKRYRLKAFEGKVLPGSGKIAVVHSTRSSDAVLQIPTLATRSGHAELAPIVWLTVGLLAAHGFALQLKLKKITKPEVRDRADGVWFVYYPTGGALTLLCD